MDGREQPAQRTLGGRGVIAISVEPGLANSMGLMELYRQVHQDLQACTDVQGPGAQESLLYH